MISNPDFHYYSEECKSGCWVNSIEMGSSSSKDAASSSSSSLGTGGQGVGRRRSRRPTTTGKGIFHSSSSSSSCLGHSSSSFDESVNINNTHHLILVDSNNNNNNNHLNKQDNGTTTIEEEEEEEEEGEKEESSPQVLKQHQHSSSTDNQDNGHDADDVKFADTSSYQQQPDDDHVSSSSRSARVRSRFSFLPGNLSFRALARAASFSSSSSSSRPSPYSLSSSANPQPPLVPPLCGGALTTAAFHHSPAPHSVRISSPESDTLRLHPHTSSCVSPNTHNDHIVSNQDNDNNDVLPILNTENTTSVLPDLDHHTSTIDNTELDFIQSRRANRRIGPHDPVERSVHFSRTLSVGRLRDRVLRRSSFTDGLFGRPQQDREVGDSTQDNGGQLWGGMTPTPDSHGDSADTSPASSTHPLSTMPNSIYNSQDDELDTSRPREARYHDIMENRTDFLERRRRIRSQVRALQRLGSRFENLSGHERSCILAGQHRSGRCTCRTSNRTRNSDDDTSARASISRIVMLAEALFEVLDEIHQQSVVLSSRPSVSSLGSIPAPKEVVESMPVKIYTKLQKHQLEDVAQCYICLVEYEEGDCMRILPCHHEFHRTCIDKWLKEIHRVCPLCRGDVCRIDLLSSEN